MVAGVRNDKTTPNKELLRDVIPDDERQQVTFTSGSRCRKTKICLHVTLGIVLVLLLGSSFYFGYKVMVYKKHLHECKEMHGSKHDKMKHLERQHHKISDQRKPHHRHTPKHDIKKHPETKHHESTHQRQPKDQQTSIHDEPPSRRSHNITLPKNWDEIARKVKRCVKYNKQQKHDDSGRVVDNIRVRVDAPCLKKMISEIIMAQMPPMRPLQDLGGDALPHMLQHIRDKING